MLPYDDQVVALHHRLGNVSAIFQLQSEIRAHCGDHIPFSEMDLLERELEFLVEASQDKRSNLLDLFIGQMTELVAAARTERNPIYFG
jgi:hypothetical protein